MVVVNTGLTLIMAGNEIIDLASKTINLSAEYFYHSIESGVTMSFEDLKVGRTYVKDVSGSFV